LNNNKSLVLNLNNNTNQSSIVKKNINNNTTNDNLLVKTDFNFDNYKQNWYAFIFEILFVLIIKLIYNHYLKK
jgi:hypothetical protein